MAKSIEIDRKKRLRDEPGDLLEIEYLDIVPERYGWTRFAQGDSECCGTAIEMGATAQVRFRQQ